MSDEKTPQYLTHATGTPVADNLNILTAGPRGPALLQDVWLLELLDIFKSVRVSAFTETQ